MQLRQIKHKNVKINNKNGKKRQNSYKFPVIPARISEIPGNSAGNLGVRDSREFPNVALLVRSNDYASPLIKLLAYLPFNFNFTLRYRLHI